MVCHETEFQRIRPIILERDNYRCQYCGAETKEVHHIDGNRANNKPENLLATCKKCNNQRKKKVLGRFKQRTNPLLTTNKEGKKVYMRFYMRAKRKGEQFTAPWLKRTPEQTTTSKIGKALYMKNYMRVYRTAFEEQGKKLNSSSLEDFM